MNIYTQLAICILCSLIAVHWGYPHILKVAKLKGLVDNPNARKLQKTPIPVLGGIIVFFGLMMGMLAFDAVSWGRPIEGVNEVFPVLLGATIMLYIGSLDDILGLTPRSRFIIEILVMLGLIYGSGLCVDSLHGLWGINDFSWWIAVPLTVFAGVGLMNAYNMVDGVNGLSSGLCLACSVLMSVICYKRGDTVDSALAACFAASLAPFFMHNVFGKRSRMFIGDGGTMVMGLLMSWFVIRLLTSDTTRSLIKLSTPNCELGLIPMMLAVASVPVFDTLRVMTTRIMHGESPFKADKTHLHHAFVLVGVSHMITSISEVVINALIILIWYAVYLNEFSIDVQLYVVLGTSMLLVWGTYFFLRQVANKHQESQYMKWAQKTHFGNKRWWITLQQWLDKGAYEDYYIINKDNFNKKPEELTQKERDTVSIVNFLQGKHKVSIDEVLTESGVTAEQAEIVLAELLSAHLIEPIGKDELGRAKYVRLCKI